MITRRQFNQLLVSLSVTTALTPNSLAKMSSKVLKVIPKSGEKISAIGMGTWITFDRQKTDTDINRYVQILHHFFQQGGQMIDSSPMYGYAQQFLGELLANVQSKQDLFTATKVWTPGKNAGIKQMQRSAQLWGIKKFDLMHVHNMLDWKTQLKTLNEWKQQGKLRYSGITTSHGRRHVDLIPMLKKNPIDFVQFSYNILDRKAEDYLLPLAQDLGVAVVINRPFKSGALFNRVHDKELPKWTKEIGCQTWSQFFLKYVISHPAITCAIPATSQLSHMQENMQALYSPLPDAHMRQEMHRYFDYLTK